MQFLNTFTIVTIVTILTIVAIVTKLTIVAIVAIVAIVTIVTMVPVFAMRFLLSLKDLISTRFAPEAGCNEDADLPWSGAEDAVPHLRTCSSD